MPTTSKEHNSKWSYSAFRKAVWEYFSLMVLFGLSIASDSVMAAAQSPRAYVTSDCSGTVFVIDTATNAIVATTPIGGVPAWIAAAPDATKVYVTDTGSNSVDVIDTATSTVVATIPVGSLPQGIAIAPDGTRAYVANLFDNSLSTISTVTNTVLVSIFVPGDYDVAITPDGTRAYLTNFGNGTVQVMNIATNAVVATIPISDLYPHGVVITPNGTRAYVSTGVNISIIDTSTNVEIGTIPIQPDFAAITPDGSRAVATEAGSNTVAVIDTATNTVVGTILLAGSPWGIAITPDGTRAYVTQGNSVAVVDITTNVVLADIPLGTCSAFGPHIAITPAAHLVTFVSGPSIRVHKMDTKLFGFAENVCLNASFPTNCPVGATLYGFKGSGWLADLSDIPTASWIYARGITGHSSPAELARYSFYSTFVIPGTPTAGTLFIAADDEAQIIVNGSIVGKIGSVTNANKSLDAQDHIHKFDIKEFLVKGENVIKVRQANGPASFGGCHVPDNYTCNPSGIVFGGSATWQ